MEMDNTQQTRQTSGKLWRCALIAGLGGILFGFDVSVIAGTNELMKTEFGLSASQLGLTVSSAFWGALTGILLAGYLSSRIGRRDSLKLAALFFLVSAVGCGFSWDWYSLMFFRALGGLGVGGSAVLGPMYIAEISPSDRRGKLVCFFQFSIVLGILVAYLSNALVGRVGLVLPVEWRVKFACEALPAIAFLAALFAIPRSPRWLASRHRLEESRAVLTYLGEPDVEKELADIQRSLELEQGRSRERLLQRKYVKPMMLAMIVGLFNNLAGINGVLYYLNSIFESAGFSKASGDVQSVIIGFTNLVFTVLAMFFIDRLGRKRLLLIGSLGLAPILLGIAAIYHFTACQQLLLYLLIGYIAFFAFSQGAVIWVYLSEIFPNRVRDKGLSLGSFFAWTMGSVVAWFFPILTDVSPALPFLVFGVSMILQFIIVAVLFPETKGVALEDMEAVMGIE
jgi:SP family arabinose:H+ symporter-like MFS transporter